MVKTEQEIYEIFAERAREDYFGSDPRNHPHYTKEYVEWMANVWRLNDLRNKRIEAQKKKMQLLDDIAEMSSEENDD